jgi:hypothetical protein
VKAESFPSHVEQLKLERVDVDHSTVRCVTGSVNKGEKNPEGGLSYLYGARKKVPRRFAYALRGLSYSAVQYDR